MSYIVGILVVIWLIIELRYNKEKIQVAKTLYIHSWENVILAILSVIFVLSGIFILHDSVPSWMKWGWTSLLSDSGQATNIIGSPVKIIENSPVFLGIDFRYVGIFVFWSLLAILIPSFALIEEKLFRHEVHNWKSVIIRSFGFGFIHMIMGVPVFVALILSVMGFFFHMRYKTTYNYYRNSGTSVEYSEEMALDSSSSYHAIYNLILVTLMTVGYVYVFYYNI